MQGEGGADVPAASEEGAGVSPGHSLGDPVPRMAEAVGFWATSSSLLPSPGGGPFWRHPSPRTCLPEADWAPLAAFEPLTISWQARIVTQIDWWAPEPS